MCVGKYGGGAKRAGSRLSRLDQLSQRLGSTLDLQTEAGVLLHWIVEAGLARSVVLFLTDEAKENLTPVTWLGTNGPAIVAVPLSEDLEAVVRQLFPNVDGREGGTISVPLVIEGELVGVLCADRPSKEGMSAGESRLWDATAGIAVATLRNIQRYQHLIQAMAQLEEQKQTERLKDDLIYSASHDLRSPVTSIRGYAQLASRQLGLGQHEQVGYCLEVIVKQVDQLHRLLDALLDVSRIQAGKLDLRCEEVDLGQLVGEIVERFASTTESHHLRLALPTGGVVGRWDRSRMEQAIANLIGNAIKYSPAGGEVAIRVEAVEGEVTVTVADQGIGIARHELERLFERFYRSPSAVSKGLGGSGLGLYITQGVIQAHDGRIWVESEEGKGSTFRIALPMYAC